MRRTDHRLAEMVVKLNKYHKKHGAENTTMDNLNVDLNTFKESVFCCLLFSPTFCLFQFGGRQHRPDLADHAEQDENP